MQMEMEIEIVILKRIRINRKYQNEIQIDMEIKTRMQRNVHVNYTPIKFYVKYDLCSFDRILTFRCVNENYRSLSPVR